MENCSGETQKRQKGDAPIKIFLFLLIVVALYLIAAVFAPDRVGVALQFSVKMFYRLLPVLGVVFVLMFLTNWLVKPAWVKKHVGHGSGLKGMMIAVAGGILSMGPVYAWYGVLSELQEQGMRPALIATFLYSRSVKIAMLPLMILYFGLTYTVVLCFYLLSFSVLNGILTERFSMPGWNDVK